MLKLQTIRFVNVDGDGWLEWFQAKWREYDNHRQLYNVDMNIVLKEMLAVVIMCMQCSEQWKFKRIHFWCDNEAVIAILSRKCCNFKRPDLMNRVRVIARLAIKNRFWFWISHIPDVRNITADLMSRVFGPELWHQVVKACKVSLRESGEDVAVAVETCIRKLTNNAPSAGMLRLCEKNWRVVCEDLY